MSRLPVQPTRALAATRRLAGDGMDRRPPHRRIHDSLRRGGGRRAAAWHFPTRRAGLERTRSGNLPARSRGPRPHSRGARGAGGARGGYGRIAPGAPQGPPGTARRDEGRARRGVVGRRRAADDGSGRGSRPSVRRLRPGRAASDAWLPVGRARGARGLGYFRVAEPFRGTADVGDRSDADRTPRGRDRHPRPP